MWPGQWAVTAESDRDRWDCEPLERVGPLRFGAGLREATTVMDARAFTSDAAPIEDFGPFEQTRVRFRKADASGRQADVVAYFVDSSV
ncbi:hypothetical protein AB0A94_26965 [Streptomyces sp. NPDC044984]|uniref:hypothetical protein n=1 Tax=Streptomyces sp. NPDC044984 TaxID=3154335 RepID=UPI0033D165E2